MQGGKAEVTGLRHGESRLNRLQVAHLTDQHNVRILAKNVAERGLEGLRVRSYLTLIHHAPLVRMQILDGILDRDDVAVSVDVDLVDDRGQRGRLSASRRTREQHQAARLVREPLDHIGYAEIAEGLDLVRESF